MFAVIYRNYIKEGQDEVFQQAWSEVANYFVQHRGAIGSCLHRSSDGLWIAYSRWPDKKTRDASWPSDEDPSAELPAEIRKAVLTIKSCLDLERSLPEIHMDVINDLL